MHIVGFCSVCSSVKKSNSIRDPKLLGWLKIKPIAKVLRATDSTVFSSCCRPRRSRERNNRFCRIAGNCLFTLYSYFWCFFCCFGVLFFFFFKYYQGYRNSRGGGGGGHLLRAANPKRANWMEVIEKLLKRRNTKSTGEGKSRRHQRRINSKLPQGERNKMETKIKRIFHPPAIGYQSQADLSSPP